MWKEQGFAGLSPYGHLMEAKRLASFEARDVCILNYDNRVCGTYRLCRVLSTKVPTDGRTKKIKVGYRECRAGEKYKPRPLTEIEVNIQQLALLVPANRKELLKILAEKESVKKGIARREDEASDEILKDVVANDTAGCSLKGVAVEASLEKTCETEGKLRKAAIRNDVTADAASKHNL